MTETASCLYVGEVVHHRLKPTQHRFRYRVFSVLFDLDELAQLGRRLRLFSHNRWNMFSFRDRDHGPRDGTPLRPWIEEQAAAAGIDLAGGSIRALCYPRMFGYVFNPLTVYFCADPAGALRCLLYEVSNTFGDKHTYVIPVTEAADRVVTQSCDKQFYVSPFLPVGGRYHFKVTPPNDRVAVVIHHDEGDDRMLNAWFSGTKAPLTDYRLARLLATHPLMTAKVIAGIHWEALRLWRKGVTVFRRQPPPSSPVTIVHN